MAELRPRVLIVGGGLTGLSSAVFLAAQGVPTLLVEKHADLLIHPRARGITARTVETYRPLGLEDRIIAATGGQANSESIGAATLTSPEPARFGTDSAEMFAAVTPASSPRIDQDKLEVLLRDRARELGADIRFSAELVAHTDRGDHVEATVRETGGAEHTVRADFLVAADGHDSPIRQGLGISCAGPGRFTEVVSIMFRTDLDPVLDGRPVGVAYLEQPRTGTVLVRVASDRWSLTVPPEDGESVADYDDRRCAALVRAAVGRDDVTVEILSQIPGTDVKQLAFTIGAQVATRYRSGRIFLAGDAAHMLPPTLGLGGSTSIQDAHNLAWKLAAVVHGTGGDRLLDSYAAERMPVALYTMGQLLAVGKARGGRGGPPTPGQAAPPMPDLGTLVFGHRYVSTAVAGLPEGVEHDAVPVSELRGEPGSRAPHVPVRRAGIERSGTSGGSGEAEPSELSTVDLFGTDLVLFTARDDWADGGRSLAGEWPLVTYRLGTDLKDAGGDLTDAYGIGADGAALVRPDGYVAWRTTCARPADPVGRLRAVLTEILG